jgi:UDP-hydrolysing UDP-N-acetyl-D-glucosamine 2-epimerase
MSDISRASGQLITDIAPEMMLVIGDRLDMLPAAVASLPFNLPLAHLHGGELTEGAIDDRIRHALTKLAHLHLVSCRSAAERVRAMGEEDWRIVLTGAPGLDTLLAAPLMEREEFLAKTPLRDLEAARERFILATVHPETNASDPLAPLQALLRALEDEPLPVLFTAPNSDPGGAAIKHALLSWIERNPQARYIETLGTVLYPNALRHATAMIGNSSSGIVEAGLLGLPVVDIGSRQKGRERAATVLNCAAEWGDVLSCLRRVISGGRHTADFTYGDGRAGPKIAKAILEFASRPRVLQLTKRHQ